MDEGSDDEMDSEESEAEIFCLVLVMENLDSEYINTNMNSFILYTNNREFLCKLTKKTQFKNQKFQHIDQKHSNFHENEE